MNASTMSEKNTYRNAANNDHKDGGQSPGTIDHLLSVVHRLESDLDVLRDDLIGSQRLASLGTVASIIAHETANLLTPVSSYAQLALSQPDNPDLTRKALLAAVEGVDRVSRITTSMLDLASNNPSSPQPDPDCKQCEPGAAFAKALDCLGRDLASDGIELANSLESCGLAISEVELQQVLLNLLINARKAMLATRRGKHRLKIGGKRSGGAYTISISDTGPGIPDAVTSSLFEPFATSTYNDDQRAKSRGTGLGLSICKEIVTRAGGEIKVAKTSPSGTTFSLSLPLA